MRRSRVWWVLTGALYVMLIASAVFATRQTVLATAPIPADSSSARQEVVDAATTSTVKILSYTPDTASQTLSEAVVLTTGRFRDDYQKLIHGTVIPGALQKRMTATASVPAVGIEALSDTQATVIVFVDQSVAEGSATPTDTSSSVRVKLELIDGNWLISAFDPI